MPLQNDHIFEKKKNNIFLFYEQKIKHKFSHHLWAVLKERDGGSNRLPQPSDSQKSPILARLKC